MIPYLLVFCSTFGRRLKHSLFTLHIVVHLVACALSPTLVRDQQEKQSLVFIIFVFLVSCTVPGMHMPSVIWWT
jgi:hypothetical protein